MIIIVEGIDRVGKTTLCEMIEERYKDYIDIRRFKDNTRYAHGHTDMMVNTEKNNTVVNMIEEGIIKNIILDRFHITEFVYGAIERSYKNDDMWDIDRRFADIDKKDTLDEDEEEIDPGMSFDGHIQNDVVLVYVVPIDIKTSSEKHGYNLERHLKWYNDFYDNTSIKNKIKVDYLTLYLALDFIDKLLDFKEGEEKPTEPIGGEVNMEFKVSQIIFDGISEVFSLPVINVNFNVYVNGLYMTEDIDYVIDKTVIPNTITFKEVYRQEDVGTLTYFVKKEN